MQALKVSFDTQNNLKDEIDILHKIKTNSAINSRFVVNIISHNISINHQLAFSMEWLPHDFYFIMKQHLNINQLRHITCGLLRGVAAGHKSRIYHRDLKP